MWKFLLIAFCCSALYGLAQQDKYEWHKDSLLVWEDFKGKPSRVAADDVAALSFCGLRFQSCAYERGEEPTYKVTAYFQRSKSWSKEEHEVQYVLEHEQLHFDIAEVYARKMRKHFQTKRVALEKSSAIYNEYYDEYVEMQDLYDEQTNHGTKDKEQAIWNEKVKKWLEELDDFEENSCY